MKVISKKLVVFLVLALCISIVSACAAKTPKISVTKVTIAGNGVTDNALTMLTDETVELAASVSPSDATNREITWATSNSAIVAITDKGGLTAITEGSANVTATVDGIIATLAVTVAKGVVLTSIKFKDSLISANVGSTTKLVLNFEPVEVTNRDVVYTISPDNGSVVDKVIVNSLGKVQILSGAKGDTTYTITATSVKYPTIATTCQIKVLEVLLSSIGITRSQEAIDLISSESNRIEIPIDIPQNVYFLVPNFMPVNTSQTNITFTSSDTSVLDIKQYESLCVYSIGAGAAVGKTVNITVKGENGKSTVLYLKIGEAKKYIANELSVEYLKSLGVDKRIFWNIEADTSNGNYDTAGDAQLSQGIWRGTKSATTYGGVNPWDGVWGIIFDQWDNPFLDNELPNQYMYNKVQLTDKANIIEFRIRSQTTASTSIRGKVRIQVLEPDGKGGYLAPVVLKKTKGIGTADANGWIVISNCTVQDYEAMLDFFYFDISAYKSKEVVFLFEVDDMRDDGLADGKMDSMLCDRICFLGAEIQETMKDRTKK